MRKESDRQSYIGGSDIGPIVGHGRFRDAVDVWREKTGRPTGDEGVSREMSRGTHLEDDALAYLQETTNVRILGGESIISDEEVGYFQGRPDASAQTEDRSEPGFVEVKVPRTEVCREIKNTGLFPEYVCQLQWYMGIGGREYGIFCILDPNEWELFDWIIEFDRELYETLRERAQEFWREHVVRDLMPALDQEKERVEVPDLDGREIIDDEEWREHAEKLMKYRKLKKRAEELEENEKEWFKEKQEEIGAEKIEIPDVLKTSWSSRGGRPRLNDTLDRIGDELPLSGVRVREILKSEGNEELAKRLLEEAQINPHDLKVKGDPYRAFVPYPQKDVDISDLLS